MAMIQMVTAAIYIVSPVNGALLCVVASFLSCARSLTHSVFLLFARKLMRIRSKFAIVLVCVCVYSFFKQKIIDRAWLVCVCVEHLTIM